MSLVVAFTASFDLSVYSLQIRVGHFEPEVITLTGEGVFPRIAFDLPRDGEDPRYCKYADKIKDLQQAATEANHNSKSNFLESVVRRCCISLELFYC